MPVYHDYPVTLHHPAFAPAVVAIDTGRMYNGDHVSPKGSPVRFPPVTVNSVDQEQEYLAKGYARIMGAKQAEANFVDAHAVKHPDEYHGFEEFPKWVRGVLCADADEEAAALAAPEPEPVVQYNDAEVERAKQELEDIRAELEALKIYRKRDVPAAKRTLKDMRDQALADAEALGIKVDGRWSLDRIMSEIEAKDVA